MLKRFTLYTLLLSIVPFFTWFIGWHWQGDGHFSEIDSFLFIITEMGSSPFALITCVLFTLLLLTLVPRKAWKGIIIIAILSVVLTQGIKTGLKNLFAEARPYIASMNIQLGQSDGEFYQLDRSVRSEMVERFYIQPSQQQTPAWLAHHRSNEVGYSFPSGHSIFAASWLLIFIGIRQRYGLKDHFSVLLQNIIAVWALLMLVSRLRFGMHYPIDLLVSTWLAWLLNGGLFWLWNKRYPVIS